MQPQKDLGAGRGRTAHRSHSAQTEAESHSNPKCGHLGDRGFEDGMKVRFPGEIVLDLE